MTEFTKHLFHQLYHSETKIEKETKKKNKDAKKRCGLHNFRAPKISLLLLHSFFFVSLFFSVYFCSIFYIRLHKTIAWISSQVHRFLARLRRSKSNFRIIKCICIYHIYYVRVCVSVRILYACSWIIKKLELLESVCTCSSVSMRVREHGSIVFMCLCVCVSVNSNSTEYSGDVKAEERGRTQLAPN